MGRLEKLKVEGKFKLGQLVMTRGVNDRVAESEEFAVFVWQSLKRHANGDWGKIGKEDRQENEFSLNKHLRLFSAYIYEERGRTFEIYIITEADRSATTILFPEEY